MSSNKPVYLTIYFLGRPNLDVPSRSAICMITGESGADTRVFTVKAHSEERRYADYPALFSSTHRCCAAALDACNELGATIVVVDSNEPYLMNATIEMIKKYRAVSLSLGTGSGGFPWVDEDDMDDMNSESRNWFHSIQRIKSVRVGDINWEQLDDCFCKLVNRERYKEIKSNNY